MHNVHKIYLVQNLCPLFDSESTLCYVSGQADDFWYSWIWHLPMSW